MSNTKRNAPDCGHGYVWGYCPHCKINQDQGDQNMDEKQIESLIEMERETKKIESLVKEAKYKAGEIGIDGIVRTIATRGRESSTPNVYFNWDGFDLHATFGAGANGTSVRFGRDVILYEARDYGRHIEVFRYGPWVEKFKEQARLIRIALDAKATEAQAEQAKNLLWAFSQVDI